MSNEKIYQMITDRVIERMESGHIPWQKPWNANSGMPTNFVSQKAYRGINVWLLATMGYASPYWLTYKQAKDLGGQVRKGEKSMPVIYWNIIEKKNDKDEIKKIGFLKYFNVFNLTQIDGIAHETVDLKQLEEFDPIAEAELIVNQMPLPPEFVDGGKTNDGRAYYHPKRDFINMPDKLTFESEAHYYGVLFHEMAHSTGHETRLDRDSLTKVSMFGDHSYSKEELVAEFTASFLRATAGIENEDLFTNSVAYLQGWVKKLRDNPKYLIQASSQAMKAANHILNIEEELNEEKKK